MKQAEDNLELLLDRWTVQPLDRDLAGPILQRIAAEERALDDLLARADAHVVLAGDLAGPIMARLAADEDELDRVLAVAVPGESLSRDLVQPVVRAVRRQTTRRRLIAALAPLAVAATIALATFIGMRINRSPASHPSPVALTRTETLVVRNLDLVRDYPVLVHWDTIRAMEQLEQEEAEQPARSNS